MTIDRTAILISLLGHPEHKVRDTVLAILSDAFIQDSAILPKVFSSWDEFGVAQAFPDFPHLSYLSIPASMIEDCCFRAKEYASRRALTDPICRAAGKLMEEVMSLPARDLAPWLPTIEQTVRVSKIFFRVNLKLLNRRIELAQMDADELLNRLQSLVPDENDEQPENDRQFDEAYWLMQALRTYHSERFDPRSWLVETIDDSDASVFKFKVLSRSLATQAAPGLEREILFYAIDDRETVHAPAIEALVRIGSLQAIELLIVMFPNVCLRAQHWIARALQRVYYPGISSQIATLRKTTSDPRLGKALFLAEIVQLDQRHADELADTLNTMVTDDRSVFDCLQVYDVLLRAFAQDKIASFQLAYGNFLQSCTDQLESRTAKLRRQHRQLRKKKSEAALKQYRKRDRDEPS